MNFKLQSSFSPKGDQPEAIKQLVEGINQGLDFQTLLGVTGSGKTFTMANVIEKVQKPTLIISHNKTLVAQLYGEFKQFFPESAVEYFVSYYDYYQPEAYIPTTNLYIEKDLSINDEIEKLRVRTTSSLLSGRRDVIVVASVSCIYGAGNPSDFKESTIRLQVGMKLVRDNLLYALVDALYSRTAMDYERGTFRVRGDVVDVFLAYEDEYAIRVEFFDDEIEALAKFDIKTGKTIENLEQTAIFPANLFVTPRERINSAIRDIQDDLVKQTAYFKEVAKHLEAKRLDERTNFDLEMIRELGYCSGIENYSRYMDNRKPGERPFCLLDYFPNDFLTFIDESHVTIPQLRAMYGGDRARKQNLVDYGFRLPAAMDNRPLKFDEFLATTNQTLYVSATPSDFELMQSGGVVVEQLIRPTGLLDPEIEVKPCINQVDDLLEEIDERIKMGDRILVTTLTKRMAEELDKYLKNIGIPSAYIHSEVKTLDRVEILRDLRLGVYKVLVGVNLLREGLDLPEVSLVAIMDADKEGFLRSETSLTQTIGRAARNVRGKVIMYADKMTKSMQKTIDETNRRRAIQMAYNEKHNIIPTTVNKSTEEIKKQSGVLDIRPKQEKIYETESNKPSLAADPVLQYMNKEQIEKLIDQTKQKMLKASKETDFMEAARLRDEMKSLQDLLKQK